MLCGYIDGRHEFFRLLSDKLGGDVSFLPLSPSGTEDVARPLNVLIVGINDEPGAAERAAQASQAATRLGGVPLIAFIRRAENSLIRDLIGSGVYDCFVETSSMEELRIILRRAAKHLEVNRELQRLRQDGECARFGLLMGASDKMSSIFSFARRIATSDASVLISGETGTGKELLARAIHDASNRAREPFVAVACASLPETLIEAELFGHEKGAFTGAAAIRKGRFEAAGKGTIFLDEIGELPPSLQVKLLRVLQECSFERIGSNQTRPMEARVICATHRDLKLLVTEGRFRADLFYRLNTIELPLPALRERKVDIAILANSFLQRFSQRQNRPTPRITPLAMMILEHYSWPGNIRELEHAMERALIVCEGTEIRPEHLSLEICTINDSGPSAAVIRSFEEEVRLFKRSLIQKHLRLSGNNKVQAARALGISRSSIHRLIEELN